MAVRFDLLLLIAILFVATSKRSSAAIIQPRSLMVDPATVEIDIASRLLGKKVRIHAVVWLRKEQVDVTIVSGKGQVVIPQAIRKKLGIGPKTKLLVYGYDDAVIMKKIKIPDVAADLKRLYSRVDKKVAKYGPLSDADIEGIINEARQKRSSG